MTLSEKIYTLRKLNNLTLEDVGKAVGVGKSTVRKWETGAIANMRRDKIETLAKALKTTPAYLMGWEEEPTPRPKKKGVKIPVLGTIAAGIPIEAVEDILDYEEIDEEWTKNGEVYFGLQIQGDSMEPRMTTGDVVIVRKQDYAETGDTVVALVNGNEATVKRIKITKDNIMLIATNPKYDPMIYTRREVEELPVHILGKVIELRAKFE